MRYLLHIQTTFIFGPNFRLNRSPYKKLLSTRYNRKLICVSFKPKINLLLMTVFELQRKTRQKVQFFQKLPSTYSHFAEKKRKWWRNLNLRPTSILSDAQTRKPLRATSCSSPTCVPVPMLHPFSALFYCAIQLESVSSFFFYEVCGKCLNEVSFLSRSE